MREFKKGESPDMDVQVQNLVNLTDPNRWKFMRRKKNINCYYAKSSNSAFYLFMGEGVVEASFEEVAVAMRDFDLFPIVDPMFHTAATIEDLNENERIVRYKYKFPPLVSNRDFVLQVKDTIYSEIPNRTGVSASLSVEHPKCAPDPNYVRGNVLVSGWVYTELSPTKTHCHYIVQFDPKGWLPAKAVNFISRTQPLNVYRMNLYFAKKRGEVIEEMSTQSSLDNEDDMETAEEEEWRPDPEEEVPKLSSSDSKKKIEIVLI